MDTIKRSDIIEGEVCFLLDIYYYGTPYRFSTIPISIEDLAENQLIPYRGGLSDPTVNLQSQRVGVDLEANTISLELVFEEVDWISEWKRGRSLNDSSCELSMVIVVEGKTSFTVQDRIGIFKGRVLDAIFGDPNAQKGNISFSIENTLNIRDIKLVGSKSIIREEEFAIGIIPQSKGKVVPFVFGNLGIASLETIDGTITIESQIPTTPAYQAGGTATLKTQYFLIAYHEVIGGKIRIYDGAGGNMVNTSRQLVDSRGFVYSYVPYYLPVGSPEGTNIEDNGFQVSSPELSFGYFASWGESDGAHPNTYGDGALTSAVDLSLYILELSGLDYDLGAWRGLEGVLNRYQFAGYVNDLEVSALDWAQNNIWELLPIEITNGSKGIKPTLNLYMYSQTIEPTHYLYDSGEVEIISGLTPLEQDIYNRIMVRFGLEGSSGNYRSKVIIDPEVGEDIGLTFSDTLAAISFSRYGLRELIIEAPFVWDLETAVRIARDKVRNHALPAYAIEISAATKYGYLDLGDIVSLTSERIGYDNHKCQIMSKSWSNNRWRFILQLEDNPLVNLRD